MRTLSRYLSDYWKLVLGALVLAAVNQVFSLLDPLIFRHIIDSYATRFHEYTSAQFIRGVSLLLGAAVGVAARAMTPTASQIPVNSAATRAMRASLLMVGIRTGTPCCRPHP